MCKCMRRLHAHVGVQSCAGAEMPCPQGSGHTTRVTYSSPLQLARRPVMCSQDARP